MLPSDESYTGSPRDLKDFLQLLQAVSVRNLNIDGRAKSSVVMPVLETFPATISFELSADLPITSPHSFGGSPLLANHARAKSMPGGRTMHRSVPAQTRSHRGQVPGKRALSNSSDHSEDQVSRTSSHETSVLESSESEGSPERSKPEQRSSSPIKGSSALKAWLESQSEIYVPKTRRSSAASTSSLVSRNEERYSSQRRGRSRPPTIVYRSDPVNSSPNPNWIISPKVYHNLCHDGWQNLKGVTESQITFYKDKEAALLNFQLKIQDLVPLSVSLAQLPVLPVGAVFFRLGRSLYVTSWLWNVLVSHYGQKNLKKSVSASELYLEQDEMNSKNIPFFSGKEDNIDQESQYRELYEHMVFCLDPIQTQNLQLETMQDQIRQMNGLLEQQLKLLEQEEKILAAEEAELVKELEDFTLLKDDLGNVHATIVENEATLKRERGDVFYTRFLLEHRQMKLVSGLQSLYPIVTAGEGNFSIRGLEIPSDLSQVYQREEEHISTALGFLCHTLLLLSKYLQIPLTHKINFSASKSSIVDSINSKGSIENEYSLFKKGVERENFHRGLQLLDRNIEELLQNLGISNFSKTSMLEKVKRIYLRTSSCARSQMALG